MPTAICLLRMRGRRQLPRSPVTSRDRAASTLPEVLVALTLVAVAGGGVTTLQTTMARQLDRLALRRDALGEQLAGEAAMTRQACQSPQSAPGQWIRPRLWHAREVAGPAAEREGRLVTRGFRVRTEPPIVQVQWVVGIWCD